MPPKTRNAEQTEKNPDCHADGSTASDHLASEMASMHALLRRMETDQKKSLADIQKSTAKIEEKLSTMSDRLDNAEARLSFLEDAAKEAKVDPPARTSELEQMRKWVDDLEAHGRRNNLRFQGFPEDSERGNAVKFLEDLLPQLLNIQFPRGLIIERAHRIPTRRQEGRPPRAIIVKFLSFQDVTRIKQAAREKRIIQWEGHRIGVFPDYTRSVEMQRRKFKECKRRLRERGMEYALVFPATLKIILPNGVERRFDDSRRALEFIDSQD